MSKTNQEPKKYNTTVTAMFQSYTGNFMTQDLDEGRIREIQEAISTLKPGNALFLKKSKGVNASGKHTYFLEIVTPSEFKKKGEDNDV